MTASPSSDCFNSSTLSTTAREATLLVDLQAVRTNYRALRAAAPDAQTGAVVKADGYGLGAAPIARVLADEGCRVFFVATVREGVALRQAPGVPWTAEILVLNGFEPADADHYARHGLTPVLNTWAALTLWAGLRETWRVTGAAAAHIDTGMNRLGLSAAEAQALLEQPHLLQAGGVSMVMSHLACVSRPSHPMNAAQRARFAELGANVKRIAPNIRLSLANTGGVGLGADYAFDLTRPGIGIYGGSPRDAGEAPLQLGLKPVAHLRAPIVQIRHVQAGETVGYGATFRAPAPMTLAITALGYADGFLRQGQSGGYGVLAGRRVPVVGRVSMDLITLDVTAAGAAARPGAMVEFLGAEASLDEQAHAAGTIGYELLTRLGARLQRRYQDGEAPPPPGDAP